MARQLEDPEDSNQTDDPHDRQGHGRRRALRLGQLRAERDEVGNNGEEVYDVHHILEEGHLAGRAGETHHQLKREPADAHGLHQEEWIVEGRGHWDVRAIVTGKESLVCRLLQKRQRKEKDKDKKLDAEMSNI